jgi:transposase
MREMINAIFLVFRGDVPWHMLPEHFPPTRRFAGGSCASVTTEPRVRVGRDASPSVAVIDTQSVKTTDRGRWAARLQCWEEEQELRASRAGLDTDGRGLEVQIHPASAQDRDGALAVLKTPRARFPSIQEVSADGIYSGQKVAAATSMIVEIVRKLPDQVGSQVLSRRWVVERFFAWINRNRRLAKDFVVTITSATAFLSLPVSCC